MQVSKQSLAGFVLVLLALGTYTGAVLSLYMPLYAYQINIPIKMLAAFICIILISTVRLPRIKSLATPNVLLISFLVMYGLRIIVNILTPGMLLRHSAEEYLFYTLFSLFIPVVAFTTVERINLHKVYEALLVCFSILSVLLLIKSSDLIGSNIRNISVHERFIGPLTLGYLGAYTFTLSVIAILNKGIGGTRRILSSLVALGCMYLIGISGSRGPLLAAFLPVYVIIMKNIFLMRGARGRLLSITFSIGLFAFVAIYGVLQNSVERMAITSSRIEYSGEPREQIFTIAKEHIIENIWTGFSVELPHGSAPHNLLLEAFMATGIVGGAIMTFLFFYGLKASVKIIFHSSNLWIGCIHLTSSVFVMLSSTMYYSTFFFVTLAVLIILEKKAS